jgi:hypothetical protein
MLAEPLCVSSKTREGEESSASEQTKQQQHCNACRAVYFQSLHSMAAHLAHHAASPPKGAVWVAVWACELVEMHQQGYLPGCAPGYLSGYHV